MKIAITGKGGVGKTTVASILARLYAEEGRTVLAADVDPDANLGMALGFTQEELRDMMPISKMRALIHERTAPPARRPSANSLRLTPRWTTSQTCSPRKKNGVKLLIMGTVETGGSGCVCPEHVMLKRVISHLILGRDDVVILDMEAGLEHLGRGTADFMDQFIVVVEPGERSIQTYQHIITLASDLGINKVRVVANKVRSEADEAYLRSRIPEKDLLGFVHINDEVAEADRNGVSPFDGSSRAVSEIREIKSRIDKG